MLNRKKKKREVCANCHFLKLLRTVGGTKSKEQAREEINLEGKDRDNVRKGNFDVVLKEWGGEAVTVIFKCHFQVWDEGYHGSAVPLPKKIYETSRKDNCFFWEHRPYMLMPAAEELQNRDYELNFVKEDRKHAICSLRIAAIALVFSIIFNIIFIIISLCSSSNP
jgi:hypothetical protein